MWSNVIKVASGIGFDIVVTMTDGYSAHVKLFKTKLLCGIETPFVSNPWISDEKIYMLYDTAHLFKNAYNNFVKENFVCPTLDLDGELYPNFSHIKGLYTMKLGKVQKMAHKLTDKVLNPQVIGKKQCKISRCMLTRIYYKRFRVLLKQWIPPVQGHIAFL